MRKATITMLLLLFISIGGVCVAAAGVHAPHDQVLLTENIIYGDPSAVNGLEVQAHVTWDDHLFWDTTLLTGAQNSVETDFRFSAKEVRQEVPEEARTLILETGPMNGYEPAGEENHGLARAYRELEEAVLPGEERELEIYLKDYMDCYPISVGSDMEGIGFSLSEYFTYDGPVEEIPDEPTRDLLWLQEYFQIPVLEEETFLISVGKDQSGRVTHRFGGSTDSDSYNMELFSVTTDEECYFVFDTHSYKEQMVDTSLLPDGYGLFCLPYVIEPAPSGRMVCNFGVEELSVYPLDPSVYIEGLYLSDDQRLLYLLTQENNVLYLTAIDCDTMDTLQKLEIYDFGGDPGTVHEIRQRDNCWVLWLRGGVLALLEKLPDGLFELEYVTTYDFEEIPEYAMSIYLEADWDGEHLAVVDKFYNGRMNEDGYYVVDFDTCGFWLLVYDENGELSYAGNYESSLSYRNERPQNDCSLIWPNPFTVNWKEE